MIKVVKALAVAAVLVFCLQVFSDNKADVDLWGNLGFVTALPGSPGFLTTNTYSFTAPTHAWINHEWLAQYLLRQVYNVGGDTGLLLLKVLIGLLLVLLMHASMRKDNVSAPVRFLFLLLVISTIGYGFSTRPHLFTYLLYATFLFLLRHHAHRPLLLLPLLPLLGLLWTNLHGAFFIGIALLSLYLLAETVKGVIRPADGRPRNQRLALLGALVAFVALTFLNPYGPRLWGFIFQSAATPRPYLSEWAACLPLPNLIPHLDFLMLTLLAAAAILASRGKRDATWIVILATAFVAAFLMKRNIPLFAITSAFVVPAGLNRAAEPTLAAWRPKVPLVAAAAMLACMILMSAHAAARFNKTAPLHIEVPQERFPSDIVEFMRQSDLRGNALVFFDWAELCIWKLHPKCSVFLDGRFTDAYSRKIVDDYLNFLYLGPHWESALTNYPVNILLLHTGNPAFREMTGRDDWQLVCTNRIAGLFLKKAEHAAFLARLQAGELAQPAARKEVLFP